MQFKLLIVSAFFAASASASTGKLGDAAVITDNPAGASYVATFLNGTVTGSAKFSTAGNRTGVEVSLDLKGFKGATGPYAYHIHEQPVPASGNCNGTLGHLDPYQRGQVVDPCDPKFPATCEVGDLAGKHGKIPNSNGSTLEVYLVFVDNYISTKPGISAFIGNRSIVIHNGVGGRIACANLTVGGVKSPVAPSPSTGPVSPASGASAVTVSGFLGLAAFMVAALAL
ncbi:Cu,Zn superoxide dismutase-like protein [Choiromyces venosus 120613-1]|uniref:superoxide dismutase n=1 Tax=Choiromyces venosus 120613-1 TaxID=1336337 RepID=A0A3N4JHA2_9PEZI|nr:Cu,Zn superoxide dismutase-like protein [Choiromyces venosus 120613-1]